MPAIFLSRFREDQPTARRYAEGLERAGFSLWPKTSVNSRWVRADPRFKILVKQMKLDEYWRETGNWNDFCKPVGEDDFECH